MMLSSRKRYFFAPVSWTGLFRAYLRTGTIDGMLASLNDPYTRFLTPPEYRELRVQTDGIFGGIGIILNQHEKVLVILKTLKGSPGEAAGLRYGDRIVKIDGRPAEAMSVDEAVAAIRGPAGTAVCLTIARGKDNGEKILELKITRANIKLPSVEWESIDDPKAGRIARIVISQFAERTTSEFEAALQAADRAHARGLILDLRNNPGGLLDAAIGVANKFLDGGVILYMLRRDSPREPFAAKRIVPRRYPVVVLVNQWSASASEIVAGALKDRGIATLVGTKTFGKGVVQEIVPIGEGSALSVTVAKYLTAGGHSIDKTGIMPDVVVDIPGAMDRALKTGNLDELRSLERLQEERAIEVLRAELARQREAA